MTRALALLLLCLGLPALAAIETTTITGTVYAPDGSVATGGSITCALTPTPGRASDGTNLQVVASRYVATISGSGTVSFTLVPNDVISPAGTVYACTYTITGPLRSTFTESWSVTTAPDPVSIGAIARVGGPTLTLPTITGAAGTLEVANGSSGLQPATGYIWSSTTGAINAPAPSSTLSQGSSTGNYTPTATHWSSIAAAYAHASQWGDPDYYLQPAVWNAAQDITHGNPLIADCNSGFGAGGITGGRCAQSNTGATISQCWTNVCTVDAAGACVTTADTTLGGGADVDNDGTIDFAVGDVVTFGNTGSNVVGASRTYIISAIGDGTGSGTDCPVPGGSLHDNRITLASTVNQNNINGPDQDASGAVDPGIQLVRVWKNTTHYTNNGFYLMGQRLGYAPRSRDGNHGSNLLLNGECDTQAALPYQNWVQGPPNSGGAVGLGSNGWNQTQPSAGPNYDCQEGSTSTGCFFLTGAASDYIESVQKIAVTPGEKLILSGYWLVFNGSPSPFAALVDDRDADGTWGENSDMRWTPSSTDVVNGAFSFKMEPFWATFTIPEKVHEVKVRFSRSNSGSTHPSIDGLSLRRATTFLADTWTEDVRSGTDFLLNDFGSRTTGVLITGDSWAAGTNIETGLEAALQTRWGRSVASQVVSSGVGGLTTAGLLDSFATAIEAYDPLYVVVITGTNDLCPSLDGNGEDCTGSPLALATWTAQMRILAQRIMSIGAIPIFVTQAPLGDNGGSLMSSSHDYRDSLRRTLLNMRSTPLYSAPQELCGQASVDFGAIAANTAASASDSTEYGLSTNMACRCTPTADFSAADDDLTWRFCYVSAANTLTARAYCSAGGGCADPAAMLVDYCCTRK